METTSGNQRSMLRIRHTSRRMALRGIAGAAVTAMAMGLPGRVSAESHHGIADPLFAPTSGDDPAAVIERYVAAVNAGDLEAILALYDDGAFHIALPSPDGSAGVCLGKAQFRMWYEQSLANGERVAVADGTMAVNGNQATFTARLSSEPWTKLGIDTLEATSEIVVIDGRIMTHVVLLTPEAVRQLQDAGGTIIAHGLVSEANPLASAPQRREAWSAPSERRGFGEPF